MRRDARMVFVRSGIDPVLLFVTNGLPLGVGCLGKMPSPRFTLYIDPSRDRRTCLFIDDLAVNHLLFENVPLLLNACKLRIDIGTLIEREPSMDVLRLAGFKIREDRIGVQTWTRSISPSSVVGFKAQDHPSIRVGITASGKRSTKDLVVIGLLVEIPAPFEHRTHLHPQIR